MSVIDKLAKEAREKKKNTYVQVEVPADIHEQVSKILAQHKISWQKLLLTCIVDTLNEAKQKTV